MTDVLGGTAVDEILQKLVTNEGFRREFEADRAKILKSFRLERNQAYALMALDVDKLVKLSRGGPSGGGVPI